jgi:hypothetical protein
MVRRDVMLRAKGVPDVDRRKRTRKRKLDAIPDTVDFRDQMYIPPLVEVGAELPLERYLKFEVPVLDQGQEGACTGFGLATVANYLLRQKRIHRAGEIVSAQMLFDMAKRYDEWKGENYDYSSARGAIKAWHKHGVCGESVWKKGHHPAITERIAKDAASRPLGAYFRVNHKDLVAMHAALTEVGIIYASSSVHAGWDNVGEDGLIVPHDDAPDGHAFAIVGYDRRGFWIQNSWGTSWGRRGFGLITYDDWLTNGSDAWVVRLGAPVDVLLTIRSSVPRAAAAQSQANDFVQLRPHIISLGNDGELQKNGQFGTSEADVTTIINDDFERVSRNWSRRRLMFFAHGGLISEDAAVDKVRALHQTFLANEIYPIFFAWHSDYLSTLKDILNDAVSQRRSNDSVAAGGVRDFLLDRLDDLMEPVARALSGKAEWTEMKENAVGATLKPKGGARFAANLVAQFMHQHPNVEIHLAGHSAGAWLVGALAQFLATPGPIASGPLRGQNGLGLPVGSVTLFAPACTMTAFRDTYLPLIRSNGIGSVSVFTLDDRHEQDDDCVGVYHKSLLYLVSNAFEDQMRVPIAHPDGEPLLGMQHFINKEVAKDPSLAPIFGVGSKWILAPNNEPAGSPNASKAAKHGGFGEEPNTVTALIARIRNAQPLQNSTALHLNSDALASRRRIATNM